MGRSKSSHRWLQEHERDHYVQKSRTEGYRSRASYKLVELDKKDKLLRPGMTVVDLGSAPGGWSQVVADKVGSNGRVIASDILPMDTIADVTFIQGDFTDDAVFEEIMAAMNAAQADLVISDMAPNMSGMKSVDQPRAMYLVELALEMVDQVLAPGGSFLVKVFQGEGFQEFRQALQQRFASLHTRKPDASRARSKELYLLAVGFK